MKDKAINIRVVWSNLQSGTTMKTEAMKVRVDRSTKERLLAIAKARGESYGVIVREAINIYLASGDANIPPALRSANAHRRRPTHHHQA